MAEDMGDKTELPTERKRRDARAKGSIAKSVDLSAGIDMFGGLLLVYYFGHRLVTGFGEMMRSLLESSTHAETFDALTVARLFPEALAKGLFAAWPIFVIMLGVIFLAHVQQVGLQISTEPLTPDINRLNPFTGFGRLFGKKAAVKSLVNVLKLSVVIAVTYGVVAMHMHEIAALPNLPTIEAFTFMFDMLAKIAMYILSLMLIIGVGDYVYQRWQFTQELKMTKQEVKDERRSSEGDEETKARSRRMGRQMVMEGLKREVPKADVVVTNPTHYSVAIKYDADKMAAPKVVAKGADELAFHIRQLAIAAGVPIVEKPPLARALYASVKVGQEVKPEFYQAVAEVLAYVFRMNERKPTSAA
jgi:flagellar biosynthetic protein FlhB